MNFCVSPYARVSSKNQAWDSWVSLSIYRRNAVFRWFFNGLKIAWDPTRGSTYLLSMVRKYSKTNVGSQVWIEPFVLHLMSSSFVENPFESTFKLTRENMLLLLFFPQPMKNKNWNQSCLGTRVFPRLGAVAWWRVFGSLLSVRLLVFCEFVVSLLWLARLDYFVCGVSAVSCRVACSKRSVGCEQRGKRRGKKAGERNRLDARIERTPRRTSPLCFFSRRCCATERATERTVLEQTTCRIIGWLWCHSGVGVEERSLKNSSLQRWNRGVWSSQVTLE